jgi:hypothetical protein
LNPFQLLAPFDWRLAEFEPENFKQLAKTTVAKNFSRCLHFALKEGKESAWAGKPLNAQHFFSPPFSMGSNCRIFRRTG